MTRIRPAHLAVALAVTLVVVAVAGRISSNDKHGKAAIKINGSRAGTPGTVEPGPEKAPKLILSLRIDNSVSSLADRPLLDARLANLAAAAAKLRATVIARALTEATDVSAASLATVDFAQGCVTDNDQCVPKPGSAQRFYDEVKTRLGKLEPAMTTDFVGALAGFARDRTEAGHSTRVVGVIISDGVGTTSACDFALISANPPPSALKRCLSPFATFDLRTMPVFLVGVGRTLDPTADIDVLRRATAIDKALVRAVSGSPRLVDLDDSPAALIAMAE